jgi:hypothetical protein
VVKYIGGSIDKKRESDQARLPVAEGKGTRLRVRERERTSEGGVSPPLPSAELSCFAVVSFL